MPIKPIGVCRSAGLAAALTTLPMSAYAVLEVTPFVSATAEHDSNVFRFRDGDEALAQRGERKRADTLMSYQAGLNANYALGLQKFTLDGTVGKYEYDRFSELDYKGHSVKGLLDWQLGSLVTGSLEASDKRELQGFETITDAIDRSLRDETGAALIVKLRLFQDWELRPRARLARARYSLETTRQQDLDEDEVALALSYLGRASLSVGLEGVLTQGEFIRREEGDGSVEEYDQETLQLVGRWTPNPISSIDYTLGASRRDNKGVDVDDDSAMVGSLGMTRNISQKTSLYGGVARAFQSAQREGESTVVSTSVNAGMYWNATPYLTLNAYGYHAWETFKDSVLEGGELGDRKDEVLGLTASVIYAPRPWINLTPALGYADRSSEVDGEEYDAFQASLEFKLLYPMR